MLAKNLITLRKQHNLSQEELAERLHVTRQTISKWERQLSVPDAQLLIQIAELFEVSVSDLLGEELRPEEETNEIAQKLEQLNALLAEKNQRSRKLWKCLSYILIGILVFCVVSMIISILSLSTYSSKESVETKVELIEE